VRILVADDDRVMSHLICSIVREAGHHPMPAYDAMQALMYAIRPPVPALIILDINMPGGTGIEALRKLKLSARTSPIPVIVLSGNTDADVPRQVKSLGAEEFLAKPIDPESFLDAIRRALGQPAP
jgi:two-component system, OmpR family, phosphate regulon response regulator PhoB